MVLMRLRLPLPIRYPRARFRRGFELFWTMLRLHVLLLNDASFQRVAFELIDLIKGFVRLEGFRATQVNCLGLLAGVNAQETFLYLFLVDGADLPVDVFVA